MSGDRVQAPCAAASIERWLSSHTGLPAQNRRSLAAAVSALLSGIGESEQTCIGISGAPGSGKTTLARALAHGLRQRGTPSCLLSLDNYYFSQGQRKVLADEVHPRLLQRGVPGTHNLEWLLADMDRLLGGDAEGLRLPVFDKSTDNIAPESQWPPAPANPRVILLEGWCIGAPPAASAQWGRLQAGCGPEGDGEEDWFAYVHQAWRNMHRELQKRLQQVWYIRVPDWECVVDWRWQQELELPDKRLKNRDEVEVFLSSFHDIVRHMQVSNPHWADRLLEAGRDHNIHLLN